MRIVFIGAVEFSERILKKIIDLKADVVGVLTKRKSPLNSDFIDLANISKQNNIPFKYGDDINFKDNVKWLKKMQPDIIFCFGFSQILNTALLNIPPKGIVGFHPAKLPQNRGKHPIIWVLVLGLTETASTFFLMNEKADSGDILDQRDIKIEYKDNARSLYDKITDVALKQIEILLPKLEHNTFQKKPQDENKANYWRKRSKIDGQIDFRMTSRAIYNLVRALTKPYIGAEAVYKGKPIKIWKAQEQDSHFKNIEYGKVLAVNNKKILVKCYDNAVWFIQHEFKKIPKVGEYLL